MQTEHTITDIPRRYPLLLGLLAALFCLRVGGQVMVGTVDLAFLPPFEKWDSGLLPYPLLLAAQIVLIGLLAMIVRDFARGRGYFTKLAPRTGRILIWASIVYALVMALRYGITMALFPEMRWFTGTIPITFHFVLATFLYTLGEFSTRVAQPPDA